MSNEKQNLETGQSKPLNMGGVSGSSRISYVKNLFEKGLIFFNKNRSLEFDRYIISFDPGSKIDYSTMSEVKVKYNSFVDAIKEIDQNAHQPWLDKRLWLIYGENNYHLKVVVFENKATVCPNGYGGCQSLIANTPEELKECCKMWWRNR